MYRQFGIELECVQVNKELVFKKLNSQAGIRSVIYNYYMPDCWTISNDRTIEGLLPAEIISPILTENDLDKIEYVVTTLKQLGCVTNSSCGLHIHWEAKDLNSRQIKNLIKLYAKFEPIIDEMLALNRKDNQYCRSMWVNGSIDWVGNLGNNLIEIGKNFKALKVKDREEHKVNLNALLKYGTLEFRQHQGTLDWLEIYHWIVVTRCMIEKAITTKRVQQGEVTFDRFCKILNLPEDTQLFYKNKGSVA